MEIQNKKNQSPFVFYSQGWTNFFLGARSGTQKVATSSPAHLFAIRGRLFFKNCSSDEVEKMGGQNQSVRPIETRLETLFFVPYHLNRTCSFHFKCVSIKSFCIEAFEV